MRRFVSLALLRRVGGACSVSLLLACNPEYENPFDQTSRPAPLPAEADIVFASNLHDTQPGAPRELYAVAADGSRLTRLTSCNGTGARCDTTDAAPGPDRDRLAMRRVLDTNEDGRLDADDGGALFFADLGRRVEAGVLAGDQRVSGIDWAPRQEFLVFSAAGTEGQDDLFVMDVNGDNRRPLTATPLIRERRPRVDPAAQVAVYERIDEGGKGRIAVFRDSFTQILLTAGGPGSERLPGTPYVVGSDADPDYSPEGGRVVFRRLTALGDGRLGYWDVYTIRTDGSELTLLAGGPAYRGAPDWEEGGIVFPETDLAAGETRLVIVQADGSGRREPVTVGGHLDISSPRWLR